MDPSPAPPAPPARRRRWLRRLGLAGLGALLAAAAFFWSCLARPPRLDGAPPLLGQRPQAGPDGRSHLGPCWFQRRPGASLLALEGDPFTLGYANASLTAELLALQERSLIETVEERIPSRAARLGLLLLVLANNRSLPEFVPPRFQEEIYGLASADRGADPYPVLGPRYHRILNYHAAHDISHWVWDRPSAGCTAFAASGPWTRDGRLLVGRAFDWEAGGHFDTNKVIARVRPEGRLAFLSVVWPGMAGAVTGLNEAQVYVSLNGAHSADRGRIGTPVSLVVRRVLEEARGIPEAVELIRAASVFVADSYLLADGKTGEAVVVEKSPARTEVRPAEGGLLLQTNHLLTAGFAADAGNADYLAEGTSATRLARLTRLLEERRGRLDPAGCAEVLRDRAAPDGSPLPLGHRSAINALIATHAVVADPAAGVLWVSRGPHQLGEFQAYSLASFGEADPPAPPLPADPLLEGDALERLARVRAALAAAERAWAREGALGPAEREGLERGLEDVPGQPELLLLLGRDAARRADPRARALLEAAAAAAPPFRSQRQEVGALLEGLGPAEPGR